MKNTMKKLLCMTLVIMLLISAVPVFAAADDVTMPYILVIDGQTRSSSTYQTTTSTALSAILEDIYPGYSASFYAGFEIDGVTVDGGAAAPASGTVTFTLTTPPAPPTPEVVVTVVLSGVGERSFNVVKGGTVTLNQALLNSHGLNLSYNHSIVQ